MALGKERVRSCFRGLEVNNQKARDGDGQIFFMHEDEGYIYKDWVT